MLALLAALAASSRADAQRRVERYESGSPESQLMGFYATTVAFSPAGLLPVASHAGSVRIALELSLVPPLSEAQRTSGFQKTQSTNLAPVLPRPRVSLALPAGFAIEGSWIPPVRAFGARASLWGASIARTANVPGIGTLVPRLAMSGGWVEGPITCNRSQQERGAGDSLYFTFVCHDRESADRFSPLALSGELLVARRVMRRVTGYAGAGVRSERTTFDVGVRQFDGTPDPDHPQLQSSATRGYLLLGAGTAGGRRIPAVGAELFYAPGTVVTVRATAALQRLRRNR